MELEEGHLEKFVPLYYRIVRDIIARIESGTLDTGDRIPSENEIRATYEVSSTTARKALADLATGGWINKKKGKGSFVSKPLIDRSIAHITSFTANMARMGRRPSTQLLFKMRHTKGEKRLVVGDAEYVLEAPYLHIVRLRLGDEIPVMVENRFISLNRCPDLETKDLSQSLFALYEEGYGCLLIRSRQSISALTIEKDAADKLDCLAGQPGFLLEGVLFTANDGLLELESCIYRGDHYHFVIDSVK